MSNTHFNFQPVIIIGAARSGTNMLRDLLTQAQAVETWPSDEINYLWRYGNAKHPTDELQPKDASPAIKKYIRHRFQSQAARLHAQWLVEKTCANSLRVEYVNQIIPEAKYVFLVRDGYDVVVSAKKRWHAPLDLKYLARKTAYIPWRDIPYYGARYLGHRVKRFFNSDRRLPTWGPRYQGIDEAVASLTALEVCAMQWKRSIESAALSLSQLSPGQVYPVRYEELVHSPAVAMKGIFDFLTIPCSLQQCNRIVSNVTSKSVGMGKKKLDLCERAKIEETITRTHSEVAAIWPTLEAVSTRSAA